MRKPFLEKLNDFAQQIEFDFDSVNYGGCCVIAAAFAKHLKKYFPVKILVANYNWMKNDKDQNISKIRKKINSNTIAEWHEHGIAFAHVLVEIEHEGKQYQLDTENGLSHRLRYAPARNSDTRYPILKGNLSIEDAEELANNPEGWNDQFDRSQIPAIQKAIDKFFRYNKPELTA